MNKTLLLIFCVIFLASCQSSSESGGSGESFGKKIDPKATITIEQLESMLGKKSLQRAKVEGVVDEVCQSKGCWMDLKKKNGEVLRVTFKDYEFFMPKNIAGKTVVVEGIASYDTTSVEMLQHYAEDAGKSPAEVAAIHEPRLEMVFEAEGVIIK